MNAHVLANALAAMMVVRDLPEGARRAATPVDATNHLPAHSQQTTAIKLSDKGHGDNYRPAHPLHASDVAANAASYSA
ncbi:MAG: hypothetical protein ACOH2N_03930 [Devosia sp.]